MLNRVTSISYTSVLSLSDVKEHLRVLHDEEDDLITACINAAGARVELHTGTFMDGVEVEFLRTGWPCIDTMEIPCGYVKSILSVKYRDSDWNEQTLSSSDYRFVKNLGPVPGRIYLLNKPTLGSGEDNVKVTFDIEIPEAVSVQMVHAMKIYVAHMYEVRQPEIVGTVMARSRLSTIEYILNPISLLGCPQT